MKTLKILTKYFVFISGLFFMGIGISLVTKAGLGTSPISGIAYVLSMMAPITFGQFTFIISMLFLMLEIILLGKNFHPKDLLQIIVGPVFGLFVDQGMIMFRNLYPENYLYKLIILFSGCIILGLGIYLEVAAKVTMNPGEGLVKIISKKTKTDFGTIKIIFDCTLVAIAIIVSFHAFSELRGVREGTVISAILVGYFTKVFKRLFTHMETRLHSMTINYSER